MKINRKQFDALIRRYLESDPDEKQPVTPARVEEAAVWFVCVINSRSIDDMSTRERAELFRDGVKPADSTDVDEYIEQINEIETDSPNDDATEMVKDDLARHFGRKL